MDQNLLQDAKEHPGNNYMLLKDVEDNRLGIFDRPLPCFGCGIGWFFSLLWELLPQRSKGASRAGCQCDSCSDIYCSSASCSCRSSTLVIVCDALVC
ncbi:uncharacterized protein [Nicotiana tomentosiformis]|uniref:uncharacterized protein isoform X3 n=1 Tax=Nicotiana tomentosiformis TaxID=4098 RepID=UPI0014460D9E|nr:uncharacterized protein LOC104115245 isoform X3 [Nicotiana tomentosiformis]